MDIESFVSLKTLPELETLSNEIINIIAILSNGKKIIKNINKGNQLLKNPKIQLAASSEMYMYYTDTKIIYKLGPYGPKHATNGTLAYRAAYGKTHIYDECVIYAEERSFLDEYTHPMIQLDSKKVMLVMSHSENTFDKDGLRNKNSP